MRCVFCQNHDIAHQRNGEDLTPEELGKWYIKLQDVGHVHNINLITPEHVVPQVVLSILHARELGLKVPIIYNTSAFDSLASLQLLDGLVDIYLPDFKVWKDSTSKRLLKADNYPESAMESIKAMYDQVGDLCFTSDGIAKKGLLVRHLVMPRYEWEGQEIMKWLAGNVSRDVFVNIMEQYHPDAYVGKSSRASKTAVNPTDLGAASKESVRDNYDDIIMYPFDDGDGLGSKYDWNLWTTPQSHLDNFSRPFDLGKGVGGGSLINGMCWTRGGKADYDAWVTLGNSGWGWDDLLPYFKKTENYTNDIDAEFSSELYIHPDASTHGSDGYIHVSYPRYFYNQSQLFLDGLQELGIPMLTDPNNGTASGGMLIPNNISPDNQTRSSARIGYYDGFIDQRPNFHVSTGQVAIRLLSDGNSNAPDGLWISGVQFAPALSTETRSISCAREVILAAGNVHSPQLLELSGIGQSDILEELDIPVVIDLPGVGNNLQDHPYVGVVYYYSNTSYLTTTMIEDNPDLLNLVEQEYYVNKTGPWTAGAVNTVAFPSLSSSSKNWTAMMQDGSSQDASKYLLEGLDPTVITGYTAQKAVLVDLLSRVDVGAYEILNDNIGLLSVSTMHPFSRGTVHIRSTNPYDPPLIDPRYCSNPLDCQILVEALFFNNQLINTTAMRLLQPASYAPFLPNATSASLMPAIRQGLRTLFHGSGATSMLPLESGGVVDTHLRVYGTENLRIVDAGIIPLVPAAHLQAPVYAIAEKAADIIKADNQGSPPHRACVARDRILSPIPLSSNSTSLQAGILKNVSASLPAIPAAFAVANVQPNISASNTTIISTFAQVWNGTIVSQNSSLENITNFSRFTWTGTGTSQTYTANNVFLSVMAKISANNLSRSNAIRSAALYFSAFSLPTSIAPTSIVTSSSPSSDLQVPSEILSLMFSPMNMFPTNAIALTGNALSKSASFLAPTTQATVTSVTRTPKFAN